MARDELREARLNVGARPGAPRFKTRCALGLFGSESSRRSQEARRIDRLRREDSELRYHLRGRRHRMASPAGFFLRADDARVRVASMLLFPGCCSRMVPSRCASS